MQMEVEAILASYHRLVPDRREEAGTANLPVKLKSGVPSVWRDIQTKVKQYPMASNLSQGSVVSFLHFLDLLHRLSMVCQESSGTSRLAPQAHEYPKAGLRAPELQHDTARPLGLAIGGPSPLFVMFKEELSE